MALVRVAGPGRRPTGPATTSVSASFVQREKQESRPAGGGLGSQGRCWGQDKVRRLPMVGDREAGRASGSQRQGSWGDRREKGGLSPALASGADLGQTQVPGLNAGPTSDMAHGSGSCQSPSSSGLPAAAPLHGH